MTLIVFECEERPSLEPLQEQESSASVAAGVSLDETTTTSAETCYSCFAEEINESDVIAIDHQADDENDIAEPQSEPQDKDDDQDDNAEHYYWCDQEYRECDDELDAMDECHEHCQEQQQDADENDDEMMIALALSNNAEALDDGLKHLEHDVDMDVESDADKTEEIQGRIMPGVEEGSGYSEPKVEEGLRNLTKLAEPLNQPRLRQSPLSQQPQDTQQIQQETETMTNTEAPTSPAVIRLQFGGLRNMGNTCYLNSALQMLASLDRFVALLRIMEPNSQQNSKHQIALPPNNLDLRDVFVRVVTSLNRGDTISPNDFKQLVDERSSLFVGYEQQDSHEFLTTLLDLLDQEWKKQYTQHEQLQPTLSLVDAALPANQVLRRPSLVHHHSFTDLQPEDIVALLEDTMDHHVPDAPPHMPMEYCMLDDQQPSHLQYKLVGGRMSRSNLDLMSYVGAAQDSPHQTPSPTVAPALAATPTVVPMDAAITQPGQAELQHTDTTPTTPTTVGPKPTPVPPSPVESYFTTEVRARLTCDACKFSRAQTETYLHLSLEIGHCDEGTHHHSFTSVEEGLSKFFASEPREVKCEKCFYNHATQTREITKLPKALLLHFKRFLVDVSPDYTSISYRKNKSHVAFPEQIVAQADNHVDGESENEPDKQVPSATTVDLGEYLASDLLPRSKSSYKIRSVVNHIGISASGGHYTADANRQVQLDGKREWNRFNDALVTPITPEDAIANAGTTAYMVMYELDD